MAGIRIRLFFYGNDSEKYWLFIDPSRMKIIQDVIKSINDKFSVVCDKLMLEDARLPEKETVDILQDRDLIRAHVITIEKSTSVTDENEAPYMKENGTPKKNKKRKKKDADKPELSSEVSICETEVQVETIKKWKDVSVPISDQVPEEVIHTEDPPSPVTETAPKRKRRKRKSHHRTSPEQDNLVQEQNTHTITTYQPPKESKHIHFNDSAEDSPAVSKPLQKHAAPIPTAPPLNALLSLRSKVFSRNNQTDSKIVNGSSYNNVPPPPREILVSPKISDSPKRVLGRSVQSVMEDMLDTPKVPDSPKTNHVYSKHVSGVSDPTRFPIFNGPPRVGDIIAFKVLELSENYNPEVSNYYQGRITQAHSSGEVTIELIGEGKPKLHSRGKFEVDFEPYDEEDDEEPKVEYETTVNYSWNQLIEPRLIFP